jgi:hypothetical protein
MLDARWDRRLMEMPITQLNRHLRLHPMSEEEEKELKAARRRFKSRGYSAKLREKRRQEHRTGLFDQAFDSENESDIDPDAEVDTRIQQLEEENHELRLQVGDMESRLAEVNVQLARAMDVLAASGIAIPPE